MNRHISKLMIAGNLVLFCLIWPIPCVFSEEAIYASDTTLKNILPNGMTVILHETHKSPVVSINVLVKCGSSTEGEYSGGGLSHFVEHMLFKSGDEKDVSKAVRKIKSFGGVINGFTSRDYTVYTATAPKEFTEETLEVLKDFIFFPDFDAVELNKEKEVIFDEIRKNKDNPESCLFDLSCSLAFHETPYKYPVIGYEDLFARLNKDNLESYFNHKYSPDNIIMVVAGDMRKESVYSGVEKIFCDVKRNFVAVDQCHSDSAQLSKRTLTENKPIQLAHAALSYKSVPMFDSSLYALDILAAALGDGEGSILTREIRDSKKLVYSISCSNATLRAGGLFYISFVTESGKVDPAVLEVLKVIEGIKKNGITQSDLEKTKKMASLNFLESLQTSEGRAMNLVLSEALANDYTFSQKYLEGLNSVTNEDIKTAADIYLRERGLNLAVIMPESFARVPEKVDGEMADGGERDIYHQVLPNGVRIVVCEDHSLPVCTMSAMFLGGVRFESKVDNGVSNLMSLLMLDGTSERDEGEIKGAVESLGGDIFGISGMQSVGIVLDLASGDWKEGFAILSDVVKHSVFDENKIDKEKALCMAEIKERDDNIVQSGLLLFRENFFKDNPYSLPVLGNMETMEGLKRGEILSYYNRFILPSHMVISVAGDIDREDFIAEVKKEFGSIENADFKIPDISSRSSINGPREIESVMDREQSIVLIGFPAVKMSDPDRYAFEVIDSVMSGSDGRLFNNVRGYLGISYSIGSVFMPGIEPGCHVFYALTSSENVAIAKDAILREVKRLKTESITENELCAAKRYLITQNICGLEECASINLRMALDELYGLGYDNFTTYEERVSTITAGQIKRVANEYFDMNNCLIVTIHGKKESGG